ncbi:Response regulator PleD [Pseudoalteromonas sp. THAF3]|uniref:GGDEF domain-containing response regulator n=1 Tax=Pseudoalteromonas TaxID=53246 RepID=UPI001109382A|nr:MULTISPECIES: response regulator [Pseudoalteromonas]QFU04118.1 Response regulator PleD [Pseudoalteromonas sp. THAF3]TLX49793.1 diguanylate cyclase response regulator [Pseudoalteromonas ruthenica]
MARVLIVEDSKVVQQVLRHLLTQKFAREFIKHVDFAWDYEQAQELLEQHTYDLALVDMTLPDCASGDAARLTIEHNVASVILTSSMDESQRQQMLELGVVDYVIKDNRDSYLYAVRLLTQLLRNKGLPVLVADDSQLSRQVLKQLLQRQLYHVIEAEDGEQALAILREDTSIKLLLCDYAMPKMDGFELVRAVRNHRGRDDLAIIGISGAGNNGLSAKFIKYGANDFLTKPFMNEEFHCRVLQTVEQLHLIEQIKATAERDYLTGMFNRRYLQEHGRRLFAKDKHAVTVALIDADNFKQINDQYGHQAGDSALRQLAQRLQQHLDEHIVARFGGEEFAVLAHCHDSAQLQQQLENVNDSLRDEPIELADSTHTLSVSIGLAAMNHHDFDACLSAADKALYRAKAQGKCQLVCE